VESLSNGWSGYQQATCLADRSLPEQFLALTDNNHQYPFLGSAAILVEICYAWTEEKIIIING
jgi:hypothetical protein